MESAEVVKGPPRAQGPHNGLPPDDALRLFDGRGTEKRIGFKGDSLGEVLDELIESWPSHRISDHLTLEVAAAFTRGRPLEPGDPVAVRVPDLHWRP